MQTRAERRGVDRGPAGTLRTFRDTRSYNDDGGPGRYRVRDLDNEAGLQASKSTNDAKDGEAYLFKIEF